MSTMNIEVDQEDRMIALGHTKREQRLAFVKEAVQEKLEIEEAQKKEREQ